MPKGQAPTPGLDVSSSVLVSCCVVDAPGSGMQLAPTPLPPSVSTSPTGLDLPDDLSFDEWQGIGQSFGVALQAAAWCIGDWLVYGERKWGRQLLMDGAEFDGPASRIPAEAYNAAIGSTGMDLQTLKNYASTCRAIPREERHPALTFGHHVSLAPLPKSTRKEWVKVLTSVPKPPSVKRFRLSLRVAGDRPRVVTDEEIRHRGEHAGHDNYIPHLTKLLTILRRTVPNMDEDQREALREDSEQLVALLTEL